MELESSAEECGCAPTPRELRALSRRSALGIGVAGGLLLFGGASAFSLAPAFAESYPSWDDVQNAKANEAAKSREVTRIEGLIQSLTAEVERTQAEAQRLSDEFYVAQQAYFDAAKRADQLKDDANRSLHEDRPQEALSLYTKAIGIQPSAVLYANRAAAQMRIGRLQKAIDDADEALKLDKTYAKAYYRKARALCDDKQYDAADRCLDEAFQNLPPNDDYRREKEREALEKLRDLVEQKRDEARGAPTAKHFEFLGELFVMILSTKKSFSRKDLFEAESLVVGSTYTSSFVR